jgi:hypothetical protein
LLLLKGQLVPTPARRPSPATGLRHRIKALFHRGHGSERLAPLCAPAGIGTKLGIEVAAKHRGVEVERERVHGGFMHLSERPVEPADWPVRRMRAEAKGNKTAWRLSENPVRRTLFCQHRNRFTAATERRPPKSKDGGRFSDNLWPITRAAVGRGVPAEPLRKRLTRRVRPAMMGGVTPYGRPQYYVSLCQACRGPTS